MNENKIEKQTFTYPFLFRIIFRFGNIVITFLLILYSIPLFVSLDQRKILVIPLFISLLVIYFLNRHYLTLYKILPYKIEADDEKIVCSEFFLSKKEIIINYNDIDSLSGGLFENRMSGIMQVCDSKKDFCFGFYHRLRNSNKLVTIILSKVKRELYDEVLEKLISKGKKK
ncbi:MAG: hypothetical protein P8X47_00090 [Ignavibacteriaceae bacterium]